MLRRLASHCEPLLAVLRTIDWCHDMSGEHLLLGVPWVPQQVQVMRLEGLPLAGVLRVQVEAPPQQPVQQVGQPLQVGAQVVQPLPRLWWQAQ